MNNLIFLFSSSYYLCLFVRFRFPIGLTFGERQAFKRVPSQIDDGNSSGNIQAKFSNPCSSIDCHYINVLRATHATHTCAIDIPYAMQGKVIDIYASDRLRESHSKIHTRGAGRIGSGKQDGNNAWCSFVDNIVLTTHE